LTAVNSEKPRCFRLPVPATGTHSFSDAHDPQPQGRPDPPGYQEGFAKGQGPPTFFL